MEPSRLKYLFNAYYNKTASPEERAEFLEFVEQSEHDEDLKALLTEKWHTHQNEKEILDDGKADEMLSAIFQGHTPNLREAVFPKVNYTHQFMRIAVAAAIFLITGMSIYTWLRSQHLNPKTAQLVTKGKSDQIVQGGKKAVLTLGDGSKITLDTTMQGMVIRQGDAKVSRQSLSTLAYHPENKNPELMVYNTLTTPKGGQYQVILPDQTRVWLNSSSSIRFPTQFKGKEREVSITGEAYFEVIKDAAMPFKITANHTEIEVLGTHFNVMAYPDESSINTALLEGSVRVSAGRETKILVPGQESRVSKSGKINTFTVDADEVLAWKNGWFNFNNCDIQKVMRQISRWYDVEVEYQGKLPTGHFSGVVSSANEIDKVLDILRTGGVNFKTEGRKIIVLP
jgi:transmembrane sensor